MAHDLDPVTLELLRDIEQNRFESQRSFAARLGIAVGLANSYIKRCMKKGWVKMSKTPARRYAYYLTPKGFSEKSRLTALYLGSSFQLYRRARGEYLQAFRQARARGWRSLALYGTGDLAEIAALSARECDWEALVVVAPGSTRREYLGHRVVSALAHLPPVDGVLVTTIDDPQGAYDALRAHLPAERIVTIPLLHISRAAEPTAGSPAEAPAKSPAAARSSQGGTAS